MAKYRKFNMDTMHVGALPLYDYDYLTKRHLALMHHFYCQLIHYQVYTQYDSTLLIVSKLTRSLNSNQT